MSLIGPCTYHSGVLFLQKDVALIPPSPVGGRHDQDHGNDLSKMLVYNEVIVFLILSRCRRNPQRSSARTSDGLTTSARQ